MILSFNTVKISKPASGRPVFARRFVLNAEQVWRTDPKVLRFREDADPVEALQTDYFAEKGLIKAGNRIDPKALWGHLKELEASGSLNYPSCIFREFRKAPLPFRNPSEPKRQLFHAVMGRLLAPDSEYFTSLYAIKGYTRAPEKADNALIALFHFFDKNYWNSEKAFFDLHKIRIDLTGCILPSRYVVQASLQGLDLNNAVLSGARIAHADLSDSLLRNADLSGADLSFSVFYAADLHGADMRNAGLFGASLRCADLSSSDLRGVRMRASDFSGASLYGAQLVPGEYKACSFEGCNMTNAAIPRWLSRKPEFHKSSNTELIKTFSGRCSGL